MTSVSDAERLSFGKEFAFIFTQEASESFALDLCVVFGMASLLVVFKGKLITKEYVENDQGFHTRNSGSSHS